MTGAPKERDKNKYFDFHGDKGHNIKECLHLSRQIKEAIKSGQSAHLVKEIKQGNTKASTIKTTKKPNKPQKIKESPFSWFTPGLGIRALGEFPSTTHGMMKFPIRTGVATIVSERAKPLEIQMVHRPAFSLTPKGTSNVPNDRIVKSGFPLAYSHMMDLQSELLIERYKFLKSAAEKLKLVWFYFSFIIVFNSVLVIVIGSFSLNTWILKRSHEMVNILVSKEEYDKVFNRLDMLNAPFEGKVFTCAKQVKLYGKILEFIDLMIQKDQDRHHGILKDGLKIDIMKF
nr:retrotransposon Gag domain-containing protein [Tanacetum cinerariifolium]